MSFWSFHLPAHGEDVNLLIRWCGKLHALALQTLYAGSIEFTQQTHDPGLFSTPGRSIEHQMWKISVSSEILQLLRLPLVEVQLREVSRTMLVYPETHFKRDLWN